MRTLLISTLLSAVLMYTAHVSQAEQPTPGKQTAQTIELPKNMAVRQRLTDEQRAAERARRDALSQEEREAEDHERRLKALEELKNPKELSKTEKETLSYWLFLPSDYQPKADKKYPLLLFLHGSGERGQDIEKVKVHGPPKLLDNPEKAKDWQFITVSPQCPENYGWSPLQLGLLLDELEKKYAVDKSRIYVTGLSMGGFGTWGLLYHTPQRFAAGVPICGGCNTLAADRLVNLPLWVFHGAKDKAVDVKMSIEMVDAIKNAGGKKVQLTVYPELEHDSWTITYNNPELYQWLLKQELPSQKKPRQAPRLIRRLLLRSR